MIFITGPLLAGKQRYIRETLGLSPDEFARRAVWDVQDLARDCGDLEALADRLAEREAVIATEIGGGVVPIDAGERGAREAAGRLSCLLSQRAERVVRVFCGLPLELKGGGV